MDKINQENMDHPSPYASKHRPYYPADDEVDLRELFAVIWRGKITIILCTLVCASLAVVYALTAQEWWTTKMKVSAPLVQDSSDFRNQIIRLRPIVGGGLDHLQSPDHIFNEFINEFSAPINKKEFFNTNAEYQKLIQNLSDDEKLKLMVDWLEKVGASQANKKEGGGPYILVFQAMDRESTVTYLNKYIAFIEKKVSQKVYSEMISLVEGVRVGLEQERAILLVNATEKRRGEVFRTKVALDMARAAEVTTPVELNEKEVFPIYLGAPALSEKMKSLQEYSQLSLFESGINILNSKLDLLSKVSLHKDIKFAQFRVLEEAEKPLTRDKPKRALIAVLGTLLGGMLGVALVLMRHAFGRKEETV